VLTEQLDERFSRASALIQVRGQRDEEAKAATARRGRLRRQLRVGLLRVFSRAGLAAAEADPSLEKSFRPIQPRTTGLDFAASARGLIEETRRHVAALGGQGVSPALVEEASALLDQYIVATDGALAARNARIKARAELQEVASDIMGLIARIDGLNQHRFANDAETLAAWQSAKAVVGPLAARNGKPEAGEPGARAGSPPPPSGADPGVRNAA
jgi:hypothetical protein